MTVRNSIGCDECGSPSPGHNATCSVSIRAQADRIEALERKLADKKDAFDRLSAVCYKRGEEREVTELSRDTALTRDSRSEGYCGRCGEQTTARLLDFLQRPTAVNMLRVEDAIRVYRDAWIGSRA